MVSTFYNWFLLFHFLDAKMFRFVLFWNKKNDKNSEEKWENYRSWKRKKNQWLYRLIVGICMNFFYRTSYYTCCTRSLLVSRVAQNRRGDPSRILISCLECLSLKIVCAWCFVLVVWFVYKHGYKTSWNDFWQTPTPKNIACI